MKELVMGMLLFTLAGAGLIYFALSLNDRIADRNRREACAVLFPPKEVALPEKAQEQCRASAILGRGFRGRNSKGPTQSFK